MKRGMRRYIFLISYCVEREQINHVFVLYRPTDEDAKAILRFIHDEVDEAKRLEDFLRFERKYDQKLGI